MPPTVPLDSDQQAAVDHREGACLVLAGPGSGKTRVIVERFLALGSSGVPPSRQLVLTYTVRAAQEMRDRAERVLGAFSGEPPLLNFHSLGRRVLRQWGWLVGVSPGFRIADGAERWLHCEAVLEELRPRTLWNPLRPHDLIDALLDLIEKAKQELVSPEGYAAWAASGLAGCSDPVRLALLERHAECAEVHRRLDQRFRRLALLDHDDCILLADTVLRTHEAARRAVCGGVDMVMVDEFQDTNLAQARLVETLVAGHGNVVVVADDDQAIYKFRGASLANLDRFARDHPDHVRITLSRNYRSTQRIVAACRALIAGASAATRIDKVVTADREEGVEVEVWRAPDVRAECAAVARACRRWIEGGEVAPDHIAWLFRRHDDMRAAVAALLAEGVPHAVHGGRGFFAQPEVKDLLALLALVDDPEDSQALIRCLHLPAWRVSARGRRRLVAAATQDERPLCDLLADPLLAAALLEDGADAAAAGRCATDAVELHASAQHADVREVVFDALERSAWLGAMDKEGEAARMQAGASLGRMAELLEAFADAADDIRLRPALRYLAILRDSGDADRITSVDAGVPGVALLTAHGAKGLEWPVVIVGGCTEWRWPGFAGFGDRLRLPDELVDEAPAPGGDTHVDEERRLFYVAATRARDRLVFTHALRRPQGWSDDRLTPFLDPVLAAGAPPRIVDVRAVAGAGVPVRASGIAPGRPPVPGVRDLRDFKDCPRRYAYRRRYHMPVRPTVQSWYGTLVHGVLERAGRLRCAGAAIGADALAEMWSAAWAGSARGFRGARPELRPYGEESLRRYAESAGWAAARLVAVEQPFTLQMDRERVSGRFDRLDQPADGAPVVVDYKTGPPRGEDGASRDLQVRAYAVALAHQEQVEEVVVELHHLQTAEVTRVEFDSNRLRRAGGQVGATLAEISQAWSTTGFPANASPYRCRRCDFRTVCDEGREAAAQGVPAPPPHPAPG